MTPCLRLIGVPGTNKVMAGELSRLAGRALGNLRLAEPEKEGLGALAYPFDPRLAALAVRYHRTCNRVLWGLFESRAARLEPLYDDLLEQVTRGSHPWLRDGATLSVSPMNTRDFAAGGRQMVGVVKNALIEGAARQGCRLSVDPENPDLFFEVRMLGDVVAVSLDLGGQSMSQRGYRSEAGEAPLRENLAAVLLMLARYDARREALVDPLAGSGTIAIEAACMGQGRAVWVGGREPAARRVPCLAEFLASPADPLFPDARPFALTNELDRATEAIGRRNAAKAGVKEQLESVCGDFRVLDPERVRESVGRRGFDPDRGVIVTNPPYGERLAPADLGGLYRDLGSWCRSFKGWRAAILVANPLFVNAFGGKPRITKPLKNGPLSASFLLYDL